MSFLSKRLKEFRELACLASRCKLFQSVNVMVRRNPSIDLFLLVLFDS